jgi:hypothetical protein
MFGHVNYNPFLTWFPTSTVWEDVILIYHKFTCFLMNDFLDTICQCIEGMKFVNALPPRSCSGTSAAKSTAWVLFIFFLVRFTSIQLALSPTFPLPGAASPPVDVVTPPRCVTLPFHRVMTNSLPLLYLPATLRPVASPLESKLKH